MPSGQILFQLCLRHLLPKAFYFGRIAAIGSWRYAVRGKLHFGSLIIPLEAVVQSYYDRDLVGLTSDSSFYLQAVLGNLW
jgi:hypothetical protein